MLETCQSHCGGWADTLVPERGLVRGPQSCLTLIPAAPLPFVTIIVLDGVRARPVVVPKFAALPQLAFVAGGGEGVPGDTRWTFTPGVYRSDRRRPLFLRQGDCLGVHSAPVSQDCVMPDCLHYRNPQEALSAASWALPFVLEAGGSARFWFAARRDPSHVILREGTWWDPWRADEGYLGPGFNGVSS